MSILTRFSLKNRAAVIIMIFLISILGMYSGSKLPMEFLPSVDNPMVTVTTLSPGTDAETLTEHITEPLEKQFKNLEHIDSMISSTSEGISRIDIFYTSKADMKEAAAQVEKMTNQLPVEDGTMKPVVSQLNTSMIPIAQIALQKEGGFSKQDEQFIEENVVPQLEDIDGVASIVFYGRSNTELAITVDPEKLNEKQLSPMQVMGALQGKEASIPAGQIKVDNETNAVRVIGQIKSVNEVKNILIAPNVKLSDVAKVEVKQDYEAISRIGGEEGLALVVIKEASKNAVSTGKAIDEKINELNDKYGEKFEVRMIMSTAEQVENAVLGMAKEVGIGAVAATIIILFFLRNIRTTIIAVVSIPLSVLITLFLLDQSNVTLNILTLGGLAVAVGRLVDDSIVVIENIFRRLQTEPFSMNLIIEGTKEVAVAITASTLTTIAVFLPVGLVSGAIGEFTLPMVLAVVYSILASLLVALTVVPLMSYLLLKNVTHKEPAPSKRYVALLQWSLSHKLIVLGVSFLLFVGSIAAYVVLPKANISSEEESMVEITMSFPADYDSEKAEETAIQLEKKLLEEDKLKELLVRMGSASEDAAWGDVSKSNEASIFVMFEKGKDTDAFIEELKKAEKEYKPADLSVMKLSYSSFGGGSGVVLNVTADQQEEMIDVSNMVMKELESVKGLEKIKSNYEDLKNEWIIDVNQKRAEEAGLTPQQIGEQMRMRISKAVLGQMTIDEEQMNVVLRMNKEGLTTKEALLDTTIMSPIAGSMKLRDVATIDLEEIKTQVYHQDGKETIQVTAQINEEDLQKVGIEVNTMVKELELPDGANVEVAGSTESMQEMFMDLFKIMGLAIGIVYLIMVITFGQARAPFAILFSLPLAVVGGILGLMVTRTPVDMNALIGALMLIGIVVTNAIVLIERVQQNKERGLSTREALLDAGAVRLRPIIMTAATTIVAMMPLVFGTAEAGSMVSKSLAVVVIGGLAVSTLLTLVVVPVMYELLDRIGRKRNKNKTQSVTPEL
ncbi:efflux RND transporter permease subunit [Bacillus sp. CGMCC 1.16541]|uniref:efflux RND transporter permease subunit n=1 Tax=Bacillus sp. CGMCC 1.16541 TaxID=2185143 RepID=UPI000D73B1B0|nr:efflux RND transporter permease subunit [Bacillus sp. CGMCC 1.16541]